MVFIGMDHFSKADDELAVAQANKTLQRNFQGYSTRGDSDIYGFGMSSISQIEDAYWQNEKAHAPYMESDAWPVARGYVLTDEDKVRRETIMRLMCDLELDYAAMSSRLGLDFAAHFADALSSMDDAESDGLIERTPGGFTVTGMGRLLIRNLAMRFDADAPGAREGQFSRTI